MAQDFSETGQPMSTKNAVKKGNPDLLYPKDEVTVYSTALLSEVGIPFGTKMVIHSNLAKKMLESKKVTESEPTQSKKIVKEDDKK